VPVGNGTTIAGIHLGFKKLYEAGKISFLPKMVATSTRRGNPIVKSFKMNSHSIQDLRRDEIKETKFNEPLTNWHSYDGQEALDAIYESRGFSDYASDSKMAEFSKLLRQEEGLYVLPASASTLAVMNDLADSKVTVKGTFTAILTGRDFE
jgi:threonine synthase